MKKVSLLILLITFVLTGCENNDLEDHSNLLKTETLETFVEIDFSNYTVTSVENLMYFNNDEDFEYEFVNNVNDALTTNIIEISTQFNNFDFSYGGLLSIVVGEKPELVIHLEYGEELINVIFYRGYHSGDVYRSVLFVYDSGEIISSIGYYNAFPTEIENIHSLINES